MTARRELHVLMTADTVGGVWTYALELCAALAPLDVRVTLATMGAPIRGDQARAAAALPNVALEPSAFALEWMPSPWRDVDAAGDWLRALAARTRPDVVHVNGYAHAALPFGAPVICVAHSCVLTWCRAVRGHDAGPEWDAYRRRVADGLRAATTVVAPTRAILRAILAAHGVEADGRVIPNGRTFAVAPRTKQEFVLAAGRLWDEAKGLAELAACADRVPWPIRVAGPTTAPAGIAAVPAAGVELLGELAPDVLAGWMSRAAIYALPARYEPFGLSLLEAALAGCAIVTGELDTLREVWGDAVAYVPPGDPAALAFVLTQLARDPLRRGALAASARARAKKYTPAAMAAAYRAVYDAHVARATEELSA